MPATLRNNHYTRLANMCGRERPRFQGGEKAVTNCVNRKKYAALDGMPGFAEATPDRPALPGLQLG